MVEVKGVKLGINPTFYETIVRPTLIRLRGNNCARCGAKPTKRKLDIHHYDYAKQNINTIDLLCRSCHKEWHKHNEMKREDYIKN